MSISPTLESIRSASPEYVDARYEIVRGVWLGRSTEVSEVRELTTGRLLVMKTARIDGVNTKEGRGRVRRADRVMAPIQNDLVLARVDAGECPRFGPYVVTERLIGRTLEALLATRRELDVGSAIHVLRSLASALASVHQDGASHGDVKPGNVFVSQWSDGMERLKLIDFGLAAPRDGDRSARTAAVRDGTCGAYWAPEVIAGTSAGDERSDLYALGLVVLEALGARPLSFAARFGTPDVASTLLAARTDVPVEVLTLLDALLATDPHARPPGAAMVLDHLATLPVGPVPRLLIGRASSCIAPRAPTWLPPARSRQDLCAVEPDRREHPRAPYVTPVRLLSGTTHIDARSEDISENGLRIVTTEKVGALDGPLHLRFALPTTGAMVSLPVAARWRRTAPGHTAIGLELLHVQPAMAATISTYLKYFAVAD